MLLENKILLILDLDEMLIYVSEKELDWFGDFQLDYYYVYKCLYLDFFLVEVEYDFLLVVWLLVFDEYVKEVLCQIFKNFEVFQFIWGNSWCIY